MKKFIVIISILLIISMGMNIYFIVELHKKYSLYNEQKPSEIGNLNKTNNTKNTNGDQIVVNNKKDIMPNSVIINVSQGFFGTREEAEELQRNKQEKYYFIYAKQGLINTYELKFEIIDVNNEHVSILIIDDGNYWNIKKGEILIVDENGIKITSNSNIMDAWGTCELKYKH